MEGEPGGPLPNRVGCGGASCLFGRIVHRALVRSPFTTPAPGRSHPPGSDLPMPPAMTMPRPDRYYSDRPIVGNEAVLKGPEAHHLAHVMRARAGTQVALFDGSGAEYLAEVKSIGRGTVRLAIFARHEVDRELPAAITLGVALPKGDRQKWLVEKAVELGVQRLIPLVTARSVAEPTPQALDRLRRHVIEASKQCGRNRLMEIAHSMRFTQFLEASRDAPLRWIAHPSSASTSATPTIPEPGQGLRGTCAGPAWMAVGPEGGFTEDEVAAALAAGWKPLDLGPRVLRVETAAVFLVALFIARHLPLPSGADECQRPAP